MARVARREPGSAELLLERYGALVWSVARRYGGRSGDAEDATQEIMLDVWSSAHRYRSDMASEATFIAMIARRRMIDRARKRRPETVSPDTLPELVGAGKGGASYEASADAGGYRTGGGSWSDGARDADFGAGRDSLYAAEDVAAAKAALSELRDEQRRVITLSVVRGLTHDEIARATGMPLGTVKTLIRRGLIRVRDSIRARAGMGGGAFGGAAGEVRT